IAFAIGWGERQRARELGGARDRLRTILDSVDIGVTVQAPGGQILYANQAAARTIGFGSPEELAGASINEITDRFEMSRPDGTALTREQIPTAAAFAGQVTDEVLIRFRVRGRSEQRFSRVRAIPIRDRAGRVEQVVNFFREVTDQTREEQQHSFLLRAADTLSSSLDYEKTLSTVANLAVPVLADWCGIDLADGDRPRRVAIAHVDPSKISLVDELERRFPSDPNAPTGVPQVIRSGKPEQMFDLPRELLVAAATSEEHLRLIDELQLCSYICVPLTVRGKTIGALTFAMAESGRRHDQRDFELAQALADRAALAIDNARLFQEVERAGVAANVERDLSEERFRLLVDNVGDYAMMMLDPSGRVTLWNPGAQQMLGYASDEIIGQHFSRFYPKGGERHDLERELARATSEGRSQYQSWHVRKDGSRFMAEVVMKAVTGARGELVGFAKVTRDLTERLRAEEDLALEAARRMNAEQESRFAEMFIGMLGHDLRNPLNAIMMGASLVKRRPGGDVKTMDRILSSAERMANMVAQLLDLTRSRLAGGIPIDPRPADVSAIVSGIVDELRLVHPDRVIEWQSEGEERGRFDVDRLAQVVSNLVGNALEHGDPSRPISVRLSGEPDQVVLFVHSEGPPIPPDLLPVIFDPYRRSTARDERSKGLGLGLFITEQVVLGHGGTIEVRSSAEEGTTFAVKLPRARIEKVAATP
ncbi:MAG TPA: PAS domain S-box protein, partial [Polyangia bacterium]